MLKGTTATPSNEDHVKEAKQETPKILRFSQSRESLPDSPNPRRKEPVEKLYDREIASKNPDAGEFTIIKQRLNGSL